MKHRLQSGFSQKFLFLLLLFSAPLVSGTCLQNSDFFGHSVGTVGDLDSNGITDIIVGAMKDDDGGFNRGAAYIIFLQSDGTVKRVQKISDTEGFLSGPGNPGGLIMDLDRLGSSVAGIGDLDNDGVPDVAVGANRTNDGGVSRGAVFILFLNSDGTVKSRQKISDIDGLLSGSGNPGGVLSDRDMFGGSIADMGDLDGDGLMELAVGAHRDDTNGNKRGAVYILSLNTDGTVAKRQKISDLDGLLSGPGNPGGLLDDEDRFGRSLANIGDINGDGVNDLAVGAHRDDDGWENAGSVYLLYLNSDGTVKTKRKMSETTGFLTGFMNPGGVLEPGDFFGRSVSKIGDLNLDGNPDLVVGASHDDASTQIQPQHAVPDIGAIYIIYLSTNGRVLARQKISNTDGYLTGAGNPGGLLDNLDHFGRSVVTIDDLDGNGVNEIVVTSPRDDDGGIDKGAVYILYLTHFGTVRNMQKISDTEGSLNCDILP